MLPTVQVGTSNPLFLRTGKLDYLRGELDVYFGDEPARKAAEIGGREFAEILVVPTKFQGNIQQYPTVSISVKQQSSAA